MRRSAYDLAIVLPNSLETALVPFLARVPLRLGYRQGRAGLMNLGLKARPARRGFRRHGPRRIPEPMPIYYARLLDLLGLPPAGVRGQLAVSDAERERIADWLRERGLAPDAQPVLLTAGASYGASKLWGPERFSAVARHLVEKCGKPCVVLAGPREVELANGIAESSGAIAATDPILPLELLKALVERCALMITGDTGPRHIAVALDRPVVCIMGPSDPRYTNYCLERTTVLRRDLDCSPCQRPVCPLGHHDCMEQITAEEVIGAAERALGLP
jgi:heptosyltransferase-2